MFKPMPSPRGTNHENLFVPARFVPSSPVAAYDSVTGLTPRKPAATASAPAKPATSTAPAAPKKPTADGPSRQESLQAILDFLAGALPPDLFAEVETALGQYVHGSQEPETPRQPAADRRRLAGDSAGMAGFFERFPSARKIGAV
jgi:hypothetical protein